MANKPGTYWDREAGRIPLTYVDMGDGTWALRMVAVNADGSPITAGASANVARATAAPPVYVEGSNVQLSVDLGGVLRSTAGGGGGAVDVSDRAARLVGVVYGSQGQQLVQTPTNFNLKVESAVGATLIDPRSIRALTIADVVDVGDRAGRQVGIVSGTGNFFVGPTGQAVGNFFPVRVTDGAAFLDPRDVTDRAARLVGHVTVDNASIAVTIAAAVDVSDRAARLVGVVYGSQAQQLKQTATNFNAQVEVAVGGALVDPRSIRALVSTDVVDVFDRAAREVGRIRIWDGTDEATVLPVRTQPATTEKTLMVADLPIRLATYQTTTITVQPAITIGVKELLALWYTGGTKDIYIVEIWASGLVTTASTTGGRTTVRVSTITTAPTGGVEEAKVDVAGGGVSAITNTMRVKTGGGAIGSTFIRRLAWHATQAIGSTYDKSIFTASSVGNGLIMRGGSSSGFSIDVEREVAHTALVDSWTIGARWLEL